MKFECECCGYVINDFDQTKMGKTYPSGGWGMHEIKGKKFFLCGGCGAGVSNGRLSPALKDMLKHYGLT